MHTRSTRQTLTAYQQTKSQTSQVLPSLSPHVPVKSHYLALPSSTPRQLPQQSSSNSLNNSSNNLSQTQQQKQQQTQMNLTTTGQTSPFFKSYHSKLLSSSQPATARTAGHYFTTRSANSRKNLHHLNSSTKIDSSPEQQHHSTDGNQNNISSLITQQVQTKNSIHTPRSVKADKLSDSGERQYLKEQTQDKRGKKTLILDLDETLVHSAFRPHAGGRQADITVPVYLDGKEQNIYVLVRPGAIEFCEIMSKYYEVVVFTASMSKYAEPLIRLMDKLNSWCSHILFREHCTYLEEHDGYVKDLSLIGRDLKDVIIIDNAPTSYLFHPENALASRSWYGEESDRELYDFIPLLKDLSNFEDVRPILSEIGQQACLKTGRDYIVEIKRAMEIVAHHSSKMKERVNVNIENDRRRARPIMQFKVNHSNIQEKSNEKRSESNGSQMSKQSNVSKNRETSTEKNLQQKENERQASIKIVRQQRNIGHPLSVTQYGNFASLQKYSPNYSSKKQSLQEDKQHYSASSHRSPELSSTLLQLPSYQHHHHLSVTQQLNYLRTSFQQQSDGKALFQEDKIKVADQQELQDSPRVHKIDHFIINQHCSSARGSGCSTSVNPTPDLEYNPLPVQCVNQSAKTKLISQICHHQSDDLIPKHQPYFLLDIQSDKEIAKYVAPDIEQNSSPSYLDQGPPNNFPTQNQQHSIASEDSTLNQTQTATNKRYLLNGFSLKKRTNRVKQIGLSQLSINSIMKKRQEIQQRREQLESNCDIAKEDCVAQKLPDHNFQTGIHFPKQYDININFTPKSEIKQPGQLFEKSQTRPGGNVSLCKSNPRSILPVSNGSSDLIEPKIISLSNLGGVSLPHDHFHSSDHQSTHLVLPQQMPVYMKSPRNISISAPKMVSPQSRPSANNVLMSMTMGKFDINKRMVHNKSFGSTQSNVRPLTKTRVERSESNSTQPSINLSGIYRVSDYLKQVGGSKLQL